MTSPPPLPSVALLVKAVVLVGLAIAIRGTLPRYRYDQLIQVSWKSFLFLYLACLSFNGALLVLFSMPPF